MDTNNVTKKFIKDIFTRVFLIIIIVINLMSIINHLLICLKVLHNQTLGPYT